METRNKLPIDWYKISSMRVYWTRQLFCWFLLSSTKLSWGNALDSWYFFSIMTGRSLVTKTCLQATWTMKEDQIFVCVLSNLPCESTRNKSICHVVSLPEKIKTGLFKFMFQAFCVFSCLPGVGSRPWNPQQRRRRWWKKVGVGLGGKSWRLEACLRYSAFVS